MKIHQTTFKLHRVNSMGIEIEKKYLVKGEDWKKEAKGKLYRQGYLSSHPDRTVRTRTVETMGYLTIKGKTFGASRSEFEYPIPYQDAVEMLQQLCERPIIEKVRYKISYHGLTWEVDEFKGENLGLVIAEIELEDENQSIIFPAWIGMEVTGEEKYYNANLFKYPFSKWSK